MLNNLAYKVIEDNADRLHLFVFENGKPIYSSNGYEHVKGVLIEDLVALATGAHPTKDTPPWNGNGNPESDYAWFLKLENNNNYTVVAECDAHKAPEVFIEDMGPAALAEFNKEEITDIGHLRYLSKTWARLHENNKEITK